ncbi:MAG: CPBP family intramembrane glutamic endopeptidase [Candidatus Hodarchaeota archaeon]
MSKIFSSENRNLILYFLITFSWSWSFWLPAVLSPTGYSEPLFFAFYLIGVFGPFVGAFSLTFINEKMEGVKKLGKQFWNVKINPKWWLVIIFLYPVLFIVPFFIAVIAGIYTPPDMYFSQPWLVIVSIPINFAINFIGAPLGEEFGWRGYALPRFQARWNAFISSIVLGIIWGIWHLPLLIISTTSDLVISIVLYILMVILVSILYTWIFNNTKGNILGLIIFHTIENTMEGLFFVPNILYSALFFGGLLLIADVLVVLIFGPKHLVRESVKIKSKKIN